MSTEILNFRPSVLPDDKRLIWYPVGVCLVLAIAAGLMVDPLVAVVPLAGLLILPGLPIAIHALYFFSVKIVLTHDRLIVIDFAGDPFVSYPRRQEIQLSSIAMTYHLEREADAQRSRTATEAPFEYTQIRVKKYRAANADPRRVRVVARTNNGLVLSNENGDQKVYLMHFHDLAKPDWQRLAREILARSPHITILMSAQEKNGLLGHD